MVPAVVASWLLEARVPAGLAVLAPAAQSEDRRDGESEETSVPAFRPGTAFKDMVAAGKVAKQRGLLRVTTRAPAGLTRGVDSVGAVIRRGWVPGGTSGAPRVLLR